MTQNPKCCAPTDTAVRVARMMKIEDVGSLPVCSSSESRRLIGIVTDRDLCLEIVAEGRDPNRTTIESCMTRDPITCRVDEDLETALDRMRPTRSAAIPVVDRFGMLAGIIAQPTSLPPRRSRGSRRSRPGDLAPSAGNL